MRYCLHILYDDDGKNEVDYPSEGVDKLIVGSADPGGAVYAKASDGGDNCIAYHPDPKKLRIGDLVECRYQNGSVWYRGRVTRLSGTDQFDAAYYDGEVSLMELLAILWLPD